MEQQASTAPVFDAGAVGLPWWQRAKAQGIGFFLPSAVFAFIPLLFARGYSPLLWVASAVLCLIVVVFFLGTALVAHWPEARRWLWVGGLIGAIALMGIVTDGDSRPAYFNAYVTTVTAALIPWRQARVVILASSLAAFGLALYESDVFGVVMSLMGFAVGWSIGTGMATKAAEDALQRAEERTAVLAVAAERERIGRDLHDILGHSLTTIAVKADLASRLVGRSDDAARAEIDSLAAVARQALADVRATASGIREVRLATELASARSVLDAAGIEHDTPAAVPALDDETAQLFGYVVREAVTNVVRHSGAKRCTITCDERSVTVADDGRGMSAAANRTGLAGLAERVRAAGGELELTSGPGTTVRATLPAMEDA